MFTLKWSWKVAKKWSLIMKSLIKLRSNLDWHSIFTFPTNKNWLQVWILFRQDWLFLNKKLPHRNFSWLQIQNSMVCVRHGLWLDCWRGKATVKPFRLFDRKKHRNYFLFHWIKIFCHTQVNPILRSVSKTKSLEVRKSKFFQFGNSNGNRS
jgi:hypothetical protein